jgi:hypothetical protein
MAKFRKVHRMLNLPKALQGTDIVYSVIEGPRWGDCDFYGAWLLAAAQTQTLWKCALEDKKFYKKIERLFEVYTPNFEEAACGFLMRLKYDLHSTIFALGTLEVKEFCMMTSLGFFLLTGRCYQMTVPARLNTAKVKRAALILARAENLEYPDELVVSMTLEEAKELREKLGCVKESKRIANRESLLQEYRRLCDTSEPEIQTL